MYPHRIRLRGPWQCEPADAPARTVTVPCRWREAVPPGSIGPARFTRRFGFPGRIDEYERVWLTLDGVIGKAEVWLNGQALGRQLRRGERLEYDVTAALRDHNLLSVELCDVGPEGGLTGEVALEVRCTAYLRGVRVEAGAGGVQATGAIVGLAERPLDLYLLIDNATANYVSIEAAPGGRPFRLTGAAPPGEHEVRVDLVNGATVWFRYDTVATV